MGWGAGEPYRKSIGTVSVHFICVQVVNARNCATTGRTRLRNSFLGKVYSLR